MQFLCSVKKLLTPILFSGSLFFANAQTVVDSFSDGNFSAAPVWNGDSSLFIVNTSSQLQLNAPALADTAYLSSTFNFAGGNTEWRFWVKLSFAPSDNNFFRFYLVADQDNLKSPLNGYYVRIGENGSNDSVDLFREDGTTSTKIIDGVNAHAAASSNTLFIKVTRDAAGNWNLYSDIAGGNNFLPEGTTTDATYSGGIALGPVCQFTTSNSTKFYVDDVYSGAPIVDTIAPALLSANAVTNDSLNLFFSEGVSLASAQNVSNYFVNNGIGAPSSATLDGLNPSLVHLKFPASFTSGTLYSINAGNISDGSGNILTLGSANFSWYHAVKYDVLINEIMADPTPVIGLPDAEYVELYNRTSLPIPISNWTFSDASTSITVPSFTIQPDSFVVLCSSSDLALFPANIQLLGFSSLPSLNNSGDDLTLSDDSGTVIHSVHYILGFYHDLVKQDGGWSMEMIDENNPCTGLQNWSASTDATGGTPGKRNSVAGSNPDVTAPDLLRANVIDSTHLQLMFDENIDSASSALISNISISGGFSVTQISFAPNNYLLMNLTLNATLQYNVVYTCTVSNMKDCSGNSSAADSVQFALPLPIAAGDIVINEVLFNPVPYGVDFVELYNRSQKILDLKNLLIGTTDTAGNPSGMTPVAPNGWLVFPGDYVAVTENFSLLQSGYYTTNPAGFIEVPNLPTYADNEGTVFIINDSLQSIDQLHYFDSWQFPLLANKEGVSLERINFNNPTQDSTNWHSAASTVGYATPAYKNSEYSDGTTDGSTLTIDPQVFSPDQDGNHDYLEIHYHLDSPGYMANLKIFDEQGREIKNLVENELLGADGFVTWDGITEEGRKARLGAYILYAEFFKPDGTTKKYKRAFAVR